LILLKSSFRRSALLLALLGTLAGCAELSRTRFPTDNVTQAAELPENVHVIPLTPENIDQSWLGQNRRYNNSNLPAARSSWQYNIGPGDVLRITVWDHPELTSPAGAIPGQPANGRTVNESGYIFYPYLGQVRVAGRLTTDVQRELTERLQEFIPDPQIEVMVAAFNAQKVVVTGAVTAPQSLQITNIPLSLLEAVNATGGILEGADSHRVSIRRNGKNHSVDLTSFLENGDPRNNPILHGGDIVNVPRMRPRQAYILGQIQTPGVVSLNNTDVSLTEAITIKGGLNEARADASGIFVFRNNGPRTDVYQLDATTPLAFVLATRFMLQPDDVVYVVSDPAARWNEIITQLVPTIGAVRQAQLIRNDL
jgi:polysaccharide export outer membrane protein